MTAFTWASADSCDASSSNPGYRPDSGMLNCVVGLPQVKSRTSFKESRELVRGRGGKDVVGLRTRADRGRF